MTPEQIKLCIKLLTSKYPNKGYEIRLDNNFRINTLHHFVKFDYDNELIYVFQPNRKPGEGQKFPFWFRMVPMEGVQEITSSHNHNDINEVAAAALFTTDEIKEIKYDMQLQIEDFADSVHSNVNVKDKEYQDL